jgi:hypothetical protein
LVIRVDPKQISAAFGPNDDCQLAKVERRRRLRKREPNGGDNRWDEAGARRNHPDLHGQSSDNRILKHVPDPVCRKRSGSLAAAAQFLHRVAHACDTDNEHHC